MKKIFLVAFCCFSLYACNKEVGSISYIQSLLSNKTWFLYYSINKNKSESFVGKSTYFVNFSQTGTTLDSDGISGYFSIQKNNNVLSINFNCTTLSGAPANYNYIIEQIGSDQMTISYQQDGIKTKKIFRTIH